VGVNRISACHDARNPASGRVMQKVGMQYEGTFRAAGRNNQGIVSLVWYSILAEDYFGTAAPLFRPLARTKQALTQEESLDLLIREKRGVLSVLGDGGYPYGVPINHWYNPEDGKLYFHSGPRGHKIDAIRQNSKASYCVMDSGTPEDAGWALNFKSVIVFGKLEIVHDHEHALEISRQISYKFTQDRNYIEDEIRNSGARVLCFALTPVHITGKRVNEK
jgi:nitroimidazol reductase NimA-like FMN-containing flavoprotein (pyridoxamine 5'-phosphate oxidase superfamily)